MPLYEIETLTKSFADVRSELSEVVSALNAEIERAQRKRLASIKTMVGRCAEKRDALKVAIESEPALFVQPRTYIFHGIKVGLTKGKGGIEWEDDDQLVRLIEKQFKDQPDLLDVLIKTTKKPLAKGLAQLDVDALKKLGCTVEETGDQVVIKPTDSAVDKVVNALLKDAVDEVAKEAA